MSQTTLNQWLNYPGSFIERLKQYGVKDVAIRVLFEGFTQPTEKEKNSLNLPKEELAWIREVIIASPMITWMFARTVIPKETLTGKEKALQFLEDRSLGSFLFQDKNLQRSAFEFTSVEKNSQVFQKISNYIPLISSELYSRHSIFTTRGKKIFLQEIFFESVGTLK